MKNGEHMAKEGRKDPEDRITIDLRGWRPTLKKWAKDPAQSIGSLIRNAIATATELWEAIENLGLPSPKPGKMEEWLRQLSHREMTEISLQELIDTKGSLSFIAEQAFLPVERIIEIRNADGEHPTPEEIIGLARALGLKPDIVEKLGHKHYHHQEKQENGC
ncbi:hypothetical protein H6F63_24605 [Trichocoleus sp. FACHB-40]|nr:hypothetical protein [Trichocoleus sp. FACHB-40]